jgi:hypothetical protein
MTRYEADLDAQIAAAHARFERSLIEHTTPPDLAADLRAIERDYWQAWRARMLWEARAQQWLADWRGGTVQ